MKRLGAIIIVVFCGIVSELLLLVTISVLTDAVATANTSISPASMANYPGLQGALLSAPWWLFFAIPVIVMAVVIGILKWPQRS